MSVLLSNMDMAAGLSFDRVLSAAGWCSLCPAAVFFGL